MRVITSANRARVTFERIQRRSFIFRVLSLLVLPWALTSCDERNESRDPLRIPWETRGGESGIARSKRRDPLRIPWEMARRDRLRGETSAREKLAGSHDSEEPPPVVADRSPAETREAARSAVESATCLASGCHDEMLDASRFHARVAGGSCLKCHVPVAKLADHRFELVDDDAGVCSTCHATGEAKSFVHLPFRERKCVSCHDPHGGGGRALLVDENQTRLCGRCHEATQGAVLHGPYAAGECSSCHEPHQSEFKALARAKSADLCLSCHNRPIEASDGSRLVTNIAALLENSSFKHGPIRNGECDGCHNAHGSEYTNLLRKRFPEDFYQDYEESHYALCFQCHSNHLVLDERTTTATNFRDGDRNLHYLHVHREKGRSCRACHKIHASNLPFHMRVSVPFGDWELPVDYHQTATGGSCNSGCHKETGHEYSRTVGS